MSIFDAITSRPREKSGVVRSVLLGSVLLFVCASFAFVARIILRGLHPTVEYCNSSQPIRCNKATYTAGMQWQRRGSGKWELIHGYVFMARTSGGGGTTNNPHASYKDTMTFKTTHPNNNPKENIIYDMSPEGLYINDQLMKTSKTARVFVVGKFGKTTPVELTDQELALFHPDAYPYSVSGSEMWNSKFRPLVDPYRIEYEAEMATDAAEQEFFNARKKLGISFDRVYGPHEGELIYYSDFEGYPNGTSRLLNAFFSSETVVSFTMLHTDRRKQVYTNPDPNRLPGYRCAYLESYPSFYMINGKKVDRDKVYIQREDGTIEPLDLSVEEYRQCTKELFASPEKLKASKIYREKIAPAIGVSVETP